MFRMGLTGGIGSGKTMVCSILEKLGAAVYYADAEARRLMDRDAGLRAGIVEMFGERAYGKNGLNRSYVAGSVFGNDDQLSRLNSLVHPAVREDFIRWERLHQGSHYVVEEAAILFESGASGLMDLSVLVYAPEELRIRRVIERDGSDRDEVIKRMGHQMSEEEKMKMADHIIYNDGSQMLLPQVVELHNMILNRIK
jgi:dephospho-CoA kinase